MAIGDILREFTVPAPAAGNGRAIAFDGTNLYVTNTGSTNIYKLDINGNFMATITSAHIYGALYYDPVEKVFWGGGYENRYELFKVDLNGNVLATINYLSIIPATLLGLDPFPGYVDGITVDPTTNNIFFSTDLGINVFEISKSGAYVGYFESPLPNSGVTTDGVNLWLAFANNPTPNLKKFTTSGVLIQNVDINVSGSYQIEDIEFDKKTFSPKCVVWALNAGTIVRAIEVSCTGTTRQQVITDIINSVAFEKAGLSHILNSQGEIIQKVISVAGITPEQLLDIDRSVKAIINSIIMLEIILQSKIQLFEDCLCD